MTALPAARPNRRLAVFLDGTWNQVSNNTNVWRMKSLCADADAGGTPQATYYDIGVNGLVGGTFGRGLGRNIIEAYKWLIEEYVSGDEIYIFGFSRGAYTARSLAGLIAKYGLLKLGVPLSIDQIYERYKRADDKTIWKLCQERDEGRLNETACSLFLVVTIDFPEEPLIIDVHSPEVVLVVWIVGFIEGIKALDAIQ